jgi:uncharacterized protein DUF3108
MRLGRPFAPLVGVAALAATAVTGPAVRAASLTATYSIALGGLPLGTADVSTAIAGEHYQLRLQARLTGLAGLIMSGGGGAQASGSVAGGRPVPAAYAVSSHTASDQRTVQVGLARGNVVAIQIAPPLDQSVDRVPLREVHKRGVVDPVSALLMPALTRGGDLLDPANCNRTIPVFDGAARFDIVLSYAGTHTVHTPGYGGPVLVCNARYLPIAGHQAERPGTRFMQHNRDMSVWLAPVAGTRVLAPLRISVATMLGTSVIEASRWTLDGGQAVPGPAAGAR